jgi:hypothetical protein
MPARKSVRRAKSQSQTTQCPIWRSSEHCQALAMPRPLLRRRSSCAHTVCVTTWRDQRHSNGPKLAIVYRAQSRDQPHLGAQWTALEQTPLDCTGSPSTCHYSTGTNKSSSQQMWQLSYSCEYSSSETIPLAGSMHTVSTNRSLTAESADNNAPLLAQLAAEDSGARLKTFTLANASLNSPP